MQSNTLSLVLYLLELPPPCIALPSSVALALLAALECLRAAAGPNQVDAGRLRAQLHDDFFLGNGLHLLLPVVHSSS